MKRKTKAVLSLLLAILFLMQLMVSALGTGFATRPTAPEPERFTNISSFECSCYISGITLYASASLKSYGSMYLHITIELQKLSDGTYSTIKTWTGSKTGISLGMDETKLINIFSTYRIKVTFNAGGETHTDYAYA